MRSGGQLPISLLALLTTVTPALSFYLPGVAPSNYKKGDLVPLTVNHLTPTLTESDPQVHSVFSFDYYYDAFHFCAPPDGPRSVSESLGSILFGDRIQTSPFELKMMENETCKYACQEQVIPAEDAKFVNEKIIRGYNINWLVDGLPAAQIMLDEGDEQVYLPGFLLGYVESADEKSIKPYLNNHYDIFVEYHQATTDTYRVVGIVVDPSSRAESKIIGEGRADCEDMRAPFELSDSKDNDVLWTYNVYWLPSDTSFATRWDKYLHVDNPKIHWFFLFMSAGVVMVLVAMVSTVLVRTLRKDIARYNRLDNAMSLDDLGGTSLADDGVQEDSGWKLVHGDVFRPPQMSPLLLSVLVGNGAQLFFMSGFTLAFALLGFLSPSNRGALSTVMILSFTLFSSVGGYVSSRAYALLSAPTTTAATPSAAANWKYLFIFTPTLLPATVFTVFFLLNLLVWARASSGAVPFTTMLVVVGIWFLISVPLSLLGSWLGFRQAPAPNPTRTNQIPRQIPVAHNAYLRPLPAALVVAVLPFAAIWVELYFVLNSIWFDRIYYMFGFLFLCFGLMIVTSAAVTVLITYFVLCAEDYRWQWRAFYTSGMSGLYVFLYALVWWGKGMALASWTAGVVFVGYSALVAGMWFILTGTIGFIAAWAFVYRIYGSLKVD